MGTDESGILFPILSQGAKSVQSGQYGEVGIDAAFRPFRVLTVDDNPEFHNELQLFPRKERILIRQHKLLSNGATVDFLYKDFSIGLTFPIECKHQAGPGTTDEKLAFTLEVLASCGYNNFWLVLKGHGFRERILRHMEKKVRKINEAFNLSGRIIYEELLYREIEQLVERGKP
jgi:hypothetical protein